MGHCNKLLEIRHANDIQIPKKLFEFIDNGINPDLFSRNVLQASLKESEAVRGKIGALEEFAHFLEKDIRIKFPDLKETLEAELLFKKPKDLNVHP